ncbi:hypothetical protein O7635_15990 [Asanoa sp. WMMD1127]|uniref:hypothetical protein n=1 Tax=Asanoa sp. WMMD1127 TaxID=3016107 RepID=UPI002417349C|nr:hypothetical protein [Asanoa sp. WMMD1127]MDG4823357.1 hypothetical protein [Asanoa sp. WMMD1127]
MRDFPDGRRPPRWAVWTAHLITLLVLPSGLWRVGLALGFSMGITSAAGVDASSGLVRGWGVFYVLALTALAEAVSLLSLGLVRPWGEVFPRWLPIVGGRRVPPTPATVVAAAGAVALMVIWTFATVNFFRLTLGGRPGEGLEFANGWWQALVIACYVPLLLWGPLLLAVTWSYYRRRRPRYRRDDGRER